MLKDIVVSKEITHKDLQTILYDLAKVDRTKFNIMIRCIYEIKVEHEAPTFELSNDRDLKFYLLSENPLEVPLYISFEPKSNQNKKMLSKDYNSVSGSNQAHNLNQNSAKLTSISCNAISKAKLIIKQRLKRTNKSSKAKLVMVGSISFSNQTHNL